MKRPLRALPAVSLLVLLAVALGIWLGRDTLLDWLAQRGYAANSQVTAFTTDDAMTPYARHLFFINRPVLDDAAAFNKACTSATEKAVVLGCYHGNRLGIYLYNVTDTRLNGVEQVTAAHEMLHQAYDRLSSKDRTQVNGLLESYEKQLSDQNIKDQLAQYQQSEPGQLDTEMFAIFGTEAHNLPAALEHYYQRYFTDRSKVVAFSDTYQNEFTSRQKQVAAYDAQLKALGSQIDTNKATLAVQYDTLSHEKTTAQAAANSGDAATYETVAKAYNQQVDRYNTLVSQTQALIDQYNSIVDARNAIAVQQEQLQQALDSRTLTP